MSDTFGPCRYCAVWHGGYWFPCLTDNPDTRYKNLALLKKTLCKGVMNAKLQCDPSTCVAALKGRAHGKAEIASTAHRLYRHYYDLRYTGSTEEGAFDDIIDEFGLD